MAHHLLGEPCTERKGRETTYGSTQHDRLGTVHWSCHVCSIVGQISHLRRGGQNKKGKDRQVGGGQMFSS